MEKLLSLALPAPVYATIGIGAYLLYFYVKKRPLVAPDFAALIFVVLDSVGIPAGVNVVKVSYTATQCGGTQIEQIYLFIGGLGVLYASVKDLFAKFKEV